MLIRNQNRHPKSKSRAVISWIEDLNSLLEELRDAEGELRKLFDPDWQPYLKTSPDEFLKQYRDTAEYLPELCANGPDHMKDTGL